MPLGIFGNLISGIFGLGSQAIANNANAEMQRETNRHNQQMQQEANQAQMAQHELAYKRSSATNQVALMQNAGMSKAGALNALSGGGVYQPAPISASTDQAPQMDNSGNIAALQMMANASANYAQRQDEMKRFNEQQRVAIEEANAQREHDLKVQRLQHGNEIDKIELQHNYDREKWTQEFAEQKKLNAKTLEKMEQDVELQKEERERLTKMFDLQLQRQRVEIAKVVADTSLTNSQRARIDQEFEHMKDVIEEWQETGDVREAEAKARKVIAECQQITESAGYQVTSDVLGGLMKVAETFLPAGVVKNLFKGLFTGKAKGGA